MENIKPLTKRESRILTTALSLSKNTQLRAARAYNLKGQDSIAQELELEADEIQGIIDLINSPDRTITWAVT